MHRNRVFTAIGRGNSDQLLPLFNFSNSILPKYSFFAIGSLCCYSNNSNLAFLLYRLKIMPALLAAVIPDRRMTRIPADLL